MDKENDIVYLKTKNGIYKCYKSEQMHKPIYYPVESKTNGYIDYNDVIDILSSDDLYNELKKQKEVIDKINEFIKELYDNTDDTTCYEIDRNRKIELLDILKGIENDRD